MTPSAVTDPYAGWAAFQLHLVKLVAPLTPDQLRLRPAPHMRTAGMLAAHLVATRAGWWHDRMGEGGPSIAEIARWDEADAHLRLGAGDLVRALHETWALLEGTITAWGDAELDVEFGEAARPARRPRSRRWIVWHVLEHDLFHGGELSQALGMHGVPGIDL